MSEPPLSSEFERWRERGDLAALGRVFDRTARDLLALAAHLVRDPCEAEDLVQATFVAAIERAASYDRGRRLEAWLAGILVKKALRVQRDRARRPDPARLAEPTADPARAAEERELAERLREALAELDEPYRGVLAAYLDGAKPHEIARAAGRAPGTVRMQLLRGLERLRRLLPAGLFALVPVRVPRGLETLRAEVLASGAGVSVAPTTVAAAGMGTASKVVLAGAALIVAAAFLVPSVERSGGGRPATSAALAPEAPSGELALAAPEVLDEPAAPARGPVALPPVERVEPAAPRYPVPAGRAGFFLVGEILGLGGADPRDVAITVASRGAGAAHGRPVESGRFAVDVTRILEHGTVPVLYVSAEHPDGSRASIERPVEDDVRAASAYDRTELRQDIELVRRTLVHGRVRVGEGDVEDVFLLLFERGPAGELVPTGRETSCAPDGSFELEARAGGEHVVVARRWGTPPATCTVQVIERERNDAGTLRLEPGGVSIQGVLRFPFEVELSQFRVIVSRADSHGGWNGVSLRDGAVEVIEERVGVRTDGLFRLDGLDPGSYHLRLDSEGSVNVPRSTIATVTAPAAGVELGAWHALARVTVRNGSVASGRATLAIAVPEWSRERTALYDQPIDVVSDRRIPLALTATAPGFRSARRELAAGRTAVEQEVELVLEPDRSLAALELTMVLPPGAPEPRAVTLTGVPVGSRGQRFSQTTGVGDGRCGLVDLPPGRYALSIEPTSRGREWMESFLTTPDVEIELAPGATQRVAIAWTTGGRARMRPEGLGSGRMRAQVRDAAGRDLAVRFARREIVKDGFHSSSTVGHLPAGPSELEPNLAPGRYELVLSDGDVERLRVPFTIVAGEVVDVPFELP